MIPLIISVKNFMCYRDNVPPLSFEGIHLACLCGDNGNGKSAIFDAITWVLWGEARAKSNDQLIHSGQSEMEVELEFLAHGQRYRALRKYSRKPASTGRVSLELQIGDNNDFKSISGNNMTETQSKINSLLHLDYDTFVNSAFLRQGHSNEFSIKKPAERKDVLANILGLDEYDLIREAAHELAEKKRIEAESIENSIQDVLHELENREQLISEGQQIKNELSGIQSAKQNIELKLKDLREKKSVVQVKTEQLNSVRNQIAKDQNDLSGWEIKLNNSLRKIDELNKIQADKAHIEKKYQDYIEARKKDNEQNLKMSKLLELNKQASELTEAINGENRRLATEIEKLKDKIKAEEAKSNQLQIFVKEVDAADNKLKQLAAREKELLNKREQLNKLNSEVSTLSSVIRQIELRIEEEKDKVKLLHSEGSRCPLCGKALDMDERKSLDKKLLSSIEQLQNSKASTTQDLMNRNRQLNELKKAISSEEISLKRESDMLHGNAVLNKRKLEEAREAENNLVKLNNQLGPLAVSMENNDYAVDAQKKQKLIQMEIEKTGYDRVSHEKLAGELKSLEKYEALKRELDNAASQIVAEQRFADDARQFITRIKELIKSNNRLVTVLFGEVNKLADFIAESGNSEEEYNQISFKEKKALADAAVNNERLERLAQREAENKKNEALLKEIRFEEQVNRELDEAFSKKGVQALLIKQAFPEIELEANRLLGKMTDNRLSLKLESQKELKSKKGEVAETLDIIISDELGTRDYEMFSGGEAFRIDLALRIALSKLLVRRAGASMPILIIDEGFGTQDSSGRERLVETIKSIEDDFEKIFVITHLEELKESFPVTITVSKGVDGSMISIN